MVDSKWEPVTKSGIHRISNNRVGEIMNLKGWKYLLTFGYSLDIYAKDDRRVGIDRKTGEVVIEYVQEITQS